MKDPILEPPSVAVDSSIATGEMLCSGNSLKQYINISVVDVLQLIMEIHIHLPACYPHESWVGAF